jgi:hypothetical protein
MKEKVKAKLKIKQPKALKAKPSLQEKKRQAKKRVVIKIAVEGLRKSADKRKKAPKNTHARQNLYAPRLKAQALEMRDLPKRLKALTQLQLTTNTSRGLDALQGRVAVRLTGEEGRTDTIPNSTPSAQTILGAALHKKLVIGALFVGQGRDVVPPMPSPEGTRAPKLRVLPAALIQINGSENRIGIAVDPETRAIITKGSFSNKNRSINFEFNPTRLSLSVNGSMRLGISKLMLGGSFNPELSSAQLGYQLHGVTLYGTVGANIMQRSQLQYSVMISFDLAAIIRKLRKPKQTLDPKTVKAAERVLAKANAKRRAEQAERRRAEAEKRRDEDERRVAKK